jgi:hypothetical protein
MFQKIKLLHTLLEERLDMEQGGLLPVVHQYGEYYENVYHDLKKHALEFMMEQLSHDTLFQYMSTIPHPHKCCGKIFDVVLCWYEQIKQYTWLKLIGLLPVDTLCLLQNAVEDVIALEYMKQCDDSKTTCGSTDPLTYQFDLELREPEYSTHS